MTPRDETLESCDFCLANMSHELRTPMTSVIGATELLLETRLDLEQRELLEGVQRSGKLLLRLINDVLDYSKMGVGKQELHVRDFDLHATVRTAVNALRPVARAEQLGLWMRIDADVPRWVRGDPVRLEQVMRSLLDNAVKFTSHGRVQLSVEVEDGSRFLRFVVSDTGPGFEAEQTSRIFEAFAQGDSSVSRRYGGAGLGLAIASRLVELMGGRIGAESVPGWGSRFWFAVELPPGSEVSARRQSTGRLAAQCLSPLPRRAGSVRRVLLAEDNELNQVLVRRALEQLECLVEVVATGAEVVEAALEGCYDVVLMDCQLPDMDGFEATRQIRGGEPRNAHVPIIALTADVMIGDRDKCLAAQMDDYLAKPFSIGELRCKVKRWLVEPPIESATADGASSMPRPPLDELRFAALRAEVGQAITAELVTIFVEDMGVRLDRLESAPDVAQLSQVAHAIKGAAGNIGAMPMAAIAELIEQSCKPLDDEVTKNRITALRTEFERVCVALAPAVSALPAASGL